MSWGLVVCATCYREIHQDGDRNVELGWRHCEDKSPRCKNAAAVYPQSNKDIVGEWCGRDG